MNRPPSEDSTLEQVKEEGVAVRYAPADAIIKHAAERFRMRACECRRMAEEVKEPDWLKTLLELAEELESEAERMEAEDR
jgi:hypothetical protein